LKLFNLLYIIKGNLIFYIQGIKYIMMWCIGKNIFIARLLRNSTQILESD